ncbi:MAG: hypothetical protein QOJ04_7012 [Caballeronia sp.]|nr:hypothetical protein [Caballeronia sp.]
MGASDQRHVAREMRRMKLPAKVKKAIGAGRAVGCGPRFWRQTVRLRIIAKAPDVQPARLTLKPTRLP